MTDKRAELVFVKRAGHDQAELNILIDGGPLCVAAVWDWNKKEKVHGLYFVYFKAQGLHFGPFYAALALAEKDMRKALKAFPQPDFWTQPLDWYRRQEVFHRWIEKNMGKPEDLIGGQWAEEK